MGTGRGPAMDRSEATSPERDSPTGERGLRFGGEERGRLLRRHGLPLPSRRWALAPAARGHLPPALTPRPCGAEGLHRIAPPPVELGRTVIARHSGGKVFQIKAVVSLWLSAFGF